MGQRNWLESFVNDWSLEEKIGSTTIISLVSMDNIKIPIYSLADKPNKDILFSYIFLPPRQMWPNIFSKMMKDKVGKKKK